METPREEESHAKERWTLIRDIGVLQVKLVVDGLRDLLLVPMSLIAGLISLLQGSNGRPGSQFYRLLAWGKETEIWINLFGAVDNSPEKLDVPHGFGDQDIDAIVGRLEAFVVDEAKRGGVTTQAKDRLNKILNSMQRGDRDDAKDDG